MLGINPTRGWSTSRFDEAVGDGSRGNTSRELHQFHPHSSTIERIASSVVLHTDTVMIAHGGH